jgi:phosphate transport system protein
MSFPVPRTTPSAEKSEISETASRAILTAKDAVMNVIDLIETGSQMAFLTVKQCEQELDQMESAIDEKLPPAITKVGERRARELLAALRFSAETERIGDLIMGIAHRLRLPNLRLSKTDKNELKQMGEMVEGMLEKIHQGYQQLDINLANAVLHADRDLNELRHSFFRRHLGKRNGTREDSGVEALFIAQAFERAGDHATNLAEELLHLVEGRSFRHRPKRKTEN